MVGTIFIITIVVLAISAVMLWSGLFIERSKIESQISNVYKQFEVLEETYRKLTDKGEDHLKNTILLLNQVL